MLAQQRRTSLFINSDLQYIGWTWLYLVYLQLLQIKIIGKYSLWKKFNSVWRQIPANKRIVQYTSYKKEKNIFRYRADFSVLCNDNQVRTQDFQGMELWLLAEIKFTISILFAGCFKGWMLQYIFI